MGALILQWLHDGCGSNDWSPYKSCVLDVCVMSICGLGRFHLRSGCKIYRRRDKHACTGKWFLSVCVNNILSVQSKHQLKICELKKQKFLFSESF